MQVKELNKDLDSEDSERICVFLEAMGCSLTNTGTRVSMIMWPNLMREWKQQVRIRLTDCPSADCVAGTT